MLTDMCGEKVRVGRAGVRRVLTNPVRIGYGLPKTFAAVLDYEKETYISTTGNGFNVTWWEGEDEKSVDFERLNESVDFFLEALKNDM